MAGLTDFASAEYLNFVTGQLVTPALPGIWMGLFTTAPTSDSGVTGAVEVSGGSYARVQIAGRALRKGNVVSVDCARRLCVGRREF